MSDYSPALLPLIDAAQVPLYLEKEGSYAGTKSFELKLGPWQASVIAELTTDHMDVEQASAFLHFTGDLYGYLISDQMGHRLRCVIFDGSLAKMSQDKARTGKIDATLKKLKPAIRAAFEYKKPTWHPIPHADLV